MSPTDRRVTRNSGKITVVGAGFMGCVIATLYARFGYDVALHDVSPDMLDSYRRRARPIAEHLAAPGSTADEIFARVVPETMLDAAVDGAFLVHEVVQEVLSIKQELFAKLDAIVAPDVVLGTNTSSFLLTDICAGVNHRERVLGIHFVTPAHVVRAVELVYADFTPPSLVDWARQFLETIDHAGVACRERPGFLINRLQFALLSEVYRVMDEGIASRDDIDTAVRLSLGPRLALWGPLLTEDLVVSKQTSLAVTDYLHKQTGDANFAVRPVLRDLVDGGNLGAVSGRGWYEFTGDYGSIVSKRDRQLGELLDWLEQKSPVESIGLKETSG